MKLRVEMAPGWVGSDRTHAPLAWVRVCAGEMRLTPRSMLVDTGASGTLLPWAVAQSLGIAEALGSAPRIKFAGIGGAVQWGRRAIVDLEFTGRQALTGVVVHFIEGALHVGGYAGVLGQCGVLERVELFQRTGDPKPFFALRGWPR